MSFVGRVKAAGNLLLRGEARPGRRRPIPPITTRDVSEMKKFFPRDKFFILGHARSGTTLLMRLIRLHPDVHCSYQAHFFTRRPLLKSLVDTAEVEEWLTRKSNRWNRGEDLSAVMLRAAAEYVMEREAAALGKRIVGDKSPMSNIHGQAVRDLHALFPEARLVYIVRDGRDVLTSERVRNFVEESRYLTLEDRRILEAFRRDPKPYLSGRRSIFTPTMIRRVARGWATNVSETDAEGKRLFKTRYATVRYEDLLGQPLAALNRLWKFLGVRDIPKPMARKVATELKANPDEEWQSSRGQDLAALLPKGQSGNWRRLFMPADKRVFMDTAGEALVRWGYESSRDW